MRIAPDGKFGRVQSKQDGLRAAYSYQFEIASTSRQTAADSTPELAALRRNANLANSNHDGTLVLTIPGDYTAQLRDASTLKEVARLEGHSGIVYLAEFSPDGTRVVTVSRDCTARVWDSATGKELVILTLVGCSDVEFVAFTADAAQIVFVDGRGGQHIKTFGSLQFRERFPAIEAKRRAIQRAELFVKVQIALGAGLGEIRSRLLDYSAGREPETTAAMIALHDASEYMEDRAQKHYKTATKIEEWPEALFDATLAAKLHPNNSEYQSYLGRTYYNIGDYQDAVKSLRKARKLENFGPTTETLSYLSMSYAKLGRVDRALSALEELQRHPSYNFSGSVDESDADCLTEALATFDECFPGVR